MGIADRLRAWKGRRKAFARVLAEHEPFGVEDWLEAHPDEAQSVASRARRLREVYPHAAIVIAVALARKDCPETAALIQELARTRSGWYLVTDKHLQELRRFLVAHGEDQVLKAVRLQLDDRLRPWMFPDVASPAFVDALDEVRGGAALATAVRVLVEFIEEVEFAEKFGGAGINNAAAAATGLWDRGHQDEAVLIWAQLAISEPALFQNPEELRPLAEALPGWIPRKESFQIFVSLQAGTSTTEQRIPIRLDVPARVARVADLLTDFPNIDWIEPLRQTWVRVEDIIRRNALVDGSDEVSVTPETLVAAQSVAAALGECAALDARMCSIVNDKGAVQPLMDSLEHLLKARHNLIAEHNTLVERYRTGFGGTSAVDRIRDLKDAIGGQDSEIAHAHESLRLQWTPVAALMHVVSDEQAYPLEVRQGAAWGLHRVQTVGGLEEPDRRRIHNLLQGAVGGRDHESTDVRELIASATRGDHDRIRDLLSAVEQYVATYDRATLDEAVSRSAPDASQLADEIVQVLDASRTTRSDSEFAERALRLLPDASRLELVSAARRGLRWIHEIVEPTTNLTSRTWDHLPSIGTLLYEELPGALEFLKRYPLRLMTLGRQRRILGKYVRDKAQFQFWTRYTPPRWFRGADPAELGEVHRRYIVLDDRSAPNAMGIYFRLFEHPQLLLPVLYHEYMHYGGPDGKPEHGITNETEVLMRETLFARHLMARLALQAETGPADYLLSFAQVLSRTGLADVGRQLFALDFENNASLAMINHQIVGIYGGQLDASQASAKVAEQIHSWNRLIHLLNKTDPQKREWYSAIDWPALDTTITRAVTDAFRTTLAFALQQDHRLTSERRNAVLQEPANGRYRDEWLNFVNGLPRAVD